MRKYYRELWNPGPVRTEARRIAKEAIRKGMAAKGQRLDLQTPKQIENAITIYLFNTEDIVLKQAKWNLEEKS